MLQLRTATSPEWNRAVLADFDSFLLDHAACERKASASAMSFVVRYPDRTALLDPIIQLAREELEHFHQVYRLIEARGLKIPPDTKDKYAEALLKMVRNGRDDRFLDRMLVFAVMEARGCERFGLVADGIEDPELSAFYADLTVTEAQHHGLLLRLAREYFPSDIVQARLDEFLETESQVVQALPVRPALH
jgi:tRNA-(ms[2]io[6]A)-hydroxylase